jgi:hypothetical protein
MKTLRHAMQSVDRCILLFVPGRGWAATNIEGVDYDSLACSEDVFSALEHFHNLGHGEIVCDAAEFEVIYQVQMNNEPWACEWWHGYDGKGSNGRDVTGGEWLRPFKALPKPVLF